MEAHFLWPESSVLRALASIAQSVPVEIVEKKLEEMFPTGYPVLFSSGRAALALALVESEVTRHDLVGVFPYASHCVLDTVSRIATPLCGPLAATASLRVAYHQWGFVQESSLPSNTIEDCVDTLCRPGAALFPGGGSFEIWSLPKILGTTSGGILWCRSKDAAESARTQREQRGGGLLPWAVRVLAKRYPRAHLHWEGAEANLGQVSRIQTGEIHAAIGKWESIVSARTRNLELIWPFAVDWLRKPTNRLPSVVPVKLEVSENIPFELGISSGYRMFERVDSFGTRSLKKVLPIPIHQDISEPWLNRVIHKLYDYKTSIK